MPNFSVSDSPSEPAPAPDSYEERKKSSYANLEAKRRLAFKKSKYDSKKTREDMSAKFEEVFKSPPYDWQMDTAEAFLLGMDVLLLAGTGSGKTIPFMLPLLLHPTKKLLIISPLKTLQEDQTSRFRIIQISATPVNGDTWSTEMKTNLLDGQYRALFAGPEMCLEHAEFRAYLRSTDLTKDLLGVIVDECHCISQWGGDFRTHYGQLDKLQGFFPPGTPFMAVSATLSQEAVKEVQAKLQIDPASSFYLNLGNDRHNIYTSVQRIKNIRSFDALLPHLDTREKTIIFCNAVKTTHQVTQYLRGALTGKLTPSSINYLHAYRSVKDKRKVMGQFRRSRVLILSATEAAGMGTDLPDISCAIQWGIPSSLTVFKQRIGRAGRNPEIKARAILFAEESMFQRRRKKARSRGGDSTLETVDTAVAVSSEVPVDEEDLEEGCDEEEAEEDGQGTTGDTNGDVETEWVKTVEPLMRGWIETEGCERDYCDRVYNNPSNRKAPLGLCCDRKKCLRRQNVPPSSSTTPSSLPSRPSTPENNPRPPSPQSTQSTPTKSPNSNGKRPMTRQQLGPATRRKAHLKEARDVLEKWRFDVMERDFPSAPFTASIILPDTVLTKLASNARLRSVADIENLDAHWVYATRYGNEVLQLLSGVDKRCSALKAAVKKAKSDERKKATAAQKERKRQEKQQESERKRQEKQQQRVVARQPLQPVTNACTPARHPSVSHLYHKIE